MANAVQAGSVQRPQDANRQMKRHQIKVNLGPSPLEFSNGYSLALDQSIINQNDISARKVDVGQLYEPFSAIEVKDRKTYLKMMDDVQKRSVVAMDYEYHTEDAYNGFISIISLCTWDDVYVMDPLYELWKDANSTLKSNLLENSSILKVFHNMDNDVLLGQTTFGCFMTGAVDLNHMYQLYKQQHPQELYIIMRQSFVDTEVDKAKKLRKIAKLDEPELKNSFLNCEKIAYDKLVNSFFGKRSNIEKNLRTSDWRIRPLGNLVNYAAKDVFYLLGLFHIFLEKIGQEGLRRAMEMSRKELLKKSSIRTHAKIEKICDIGTLSPVQFSTLRRIFAWRLNIAKRTDKNPKYILSDSNLMKLSKSSITEESQLSTFFDTLKSPCDELLKQKKTLLAYLINDEAAIHCKETSICHNCNEIGHLGFECYEEPSAAARSAFLNRPENKDKKQRQRERRNRNYQANQAKRAMLP